MIQRLDSSSASSLPPPLIVHIPHASTVIPKGIRSTLCLTDDELRHELLVMTDRYTDELFGLPGDLAESIVFPVSRLVVDPERFSDDECEPMADKGMGVIYTRASTGAALRREVTPEERRGLLDTYYFPHQQTVASAVADALAAHGKCLLVDAHSFSSTPLPHEPDQAPNRCHVCIGTDDYHTPPRLIDWLRDSFEHLGIAVGINRPFAGTFVSSDYYRKNRNVASVMIEINRSLYMDEATGERLQSFSQFQSRLRQVLMDLAFAFRSCTLHSNRPES